MIFAFKKGELCHVLAVGKYEMRVHCTVHTQVKEKAPSSSFVLARAQNLTGGKQQKCTSRTYKACVFAIFWYTRSHKGKFQV